MRTHRGWCTGGTVTGITTTARGWVGDCSCGRDRVRVTAAGTAYRHKVSGLTRDEARELRRLIGLPARTAGDLLDGDTVAGCVVTVERSGDRVAVTARGDDGRLLFTVRQPASTPVEELTVYARAALTWGAVVTVVLEDEGGKA